MARGRPRKIAANLDAKPNEEQGRGRPRKDRPNTPDAVLVKSYMSEYTELKSSSERLSAEIASLFKQFEAQGGSRAQLKAMWSLSRLDEGEARAYISQMVNYARIFGLADGADDEAGEGLFRNDDLPPTPGALAVDARLLSARAYSDGYNSGRQSGRPGDNPHLAGTEGYVQWQRGVVDGLADKAGGAVENGPRIGGAAEASDDESDLGDFPAMRLVQ